MQEGSRLCQAEQQQRQVTGLDVPLADECIAECTGIGGEAVHLLSLLRVTLDHFDSVQRLRNLGVHLPKGAADVLGNRPQLTQVGPDRERVAHREQGRDEQQRGMVARGDDQRQQHEIGGADHEVEAGVEHQPDLVHIVCRSGHRVANRL